MSDTKQFVVSISRAHKVAERLSQLAQEAGETAKKAYLNTRVDGYAGDAQATALDLLATKADDALEAHAGYGKALADVRTAIAVANAKQGINALLSELEAVNRRTKLLKDIVGGQRTEMVAPNALEGYKAVGGSEAMRYRGEEAPGRIHVRLLDAEQLAEIQAQLDSLKVRAFALSDQIADANRATVEVVMGEALAKEVGLV